MKNLLNILSELKILSTGRRLRLQGSLTIDRKTALTWRFTHITHILSQPQAQDALWDFVFVVPPLSLQARRRDLQEKLTLQLSSSLVDVLVFSLSAMPKSLISV